jgi:hypothetical protein
VHQDLALAPDLRAIIDDGRGRMAADARLLTAPDLVCAVIRHGDNAGARLIASFRVDLPDPRPADREPGDGALDEGSRSLLEAAARVARELDDGAVATEHVVIAASEVEPLHAGVYAALGISPALLRAQLARLRADPSTRDLLEPQVDPAFDALVDEALHRLADGVA